MRGWISLAGVLAGAALALALVDALLADRARERMDRLGSTLAETTARLGLPAVLQQDRIALGNLASRIIAFDEVVGCSLYTVDGRTLAFAGEDSNDPNTGHYTAPITAEDTLAGYARVVLDRRRFRVGRGELVAAAWPIAPAGLAVAALIALLRRRPGRASPTAGTAPDPLPAKFVLVANLFNQGRLRPMRQKTVLTHALEHATDIAQSHGGRAWALPGARVLIAFDDRPDGARAFEVVCAALELGTALEAAPPPDQDGPPTPSFRFGLHLCDAWADEAGVEESAHVSDAALLSALAPDGRLAISQDVFERIERADTLEMDTAPELSQAALTGTTLGRCRIVRGLAA